MPTPATRFTLRFVSTVTMSCLKTYFNDTFWSVACFDRTSQTTSDPAWPTVESTSFEQPLFLFGLTVLNVSWHAGHEILHSGTTIEMQEEFARR